MINLSVFENNMREWILEFTPFKQKLEKELIDYARLPIRKFSNIYMEKSANYQRLPPTVSTEYLGEWNQTIAAIKIINNDLESGCKHIGIANGYNYLTFISNVSFFKKNMIRTCRVQRNWASKLFFTLAASNNDKEMKEVMLDLKYLNDNNFIGDFGSKISIFALSMVDLLAGEDIYKALSKFDSILVGFKDSTDALDMYKKMVISYHGYNSQLDWNELIADSIELHQKESIVSDSDDECFDYDEEHWAAIPYEIIGYVNLVTDKFNVKIDFPDNELGIICRKLVGKYIPMEYDSIAQGVFNRAQKVLF